MKRGDGHYFERRPGRWQIKVEAGQSADGKRTYHRLQITGTKEDAKAALAKLVAEKLHGNLVEPSKGTLAEWVEIWLRDHMKESVEAKTHERYAELLNLHVVPTLGKIKLQRLTGGAIQTLYMQLVPKLAARTRLHVHRVLSQCLGAAVRMSILANNPARNVTVPRKKSSEGGEGQEMKVLEADQLRALLSSMGDTPLRDIAWVAAATGARRSEVLALQWRDVDTDARTLTIERALEDTAEHGVRVKAPKNKSSKRTIGIDPETADLLRSLRARFAELKLLAGKGALEKWFVFPGDPGDPTEPRNPRAVTKAFMLKAAAAGFPGFRFHDLRHTHATLLLVGGAPITAVAQRLGHANANITLGVYAHVLRRAEDQAVAITAGFMRASAPAKLEAP